MIRLLATSTKTLQRRMFSTPTSKSQWIDRAFSDSSVPPLKVLSNNLIKELAVDCSSDEMKDSSTPLVDAIQHVLVTGPCTMNDIIEFSEETIGNENCYLDEEDFEILSACIIEGFHKTASTEGRDPSMITRIVQAFTNAHSWNAPIFHEGIDLMTRRQNELTSEQKRILGECLFKYRTEHSGTVHRDGYEVKASKTTEHDERNKFRLNRPSRGS